MTAVIYFISSIIACIINFIIIILTYYITLLKLYEQNRDVGEKDGDI